MKRLIIFAGAILAALVVWVVRSAVFVDESEFVLITDFGRPVDLFGDQPGESGLHWIAPWREATRIDRRLHVFDAPTREVITGDKRNLEVSAYVAWRVVDPARFLRAAGSVDAAEARLGERVAAALSDTLGRSPASALASTDPKIWALDRLVDEAARGLGPSATAELGVELIELGIRRFVPPVEVRPAVFELIRGERRQVAAKLRAEGEAAYAETIAKADRERDGLIAAAEAEAERVEGKARAEVARILNEAHAIDPAFADFLRTLETYRSVLDERAVVVLSATSPLLHMLTHGPSPEVLAAPASPAPAPRGERR
ncbi:MAG: protease modulator HflC [Isosphaeraceae bacterium]|nr:protease modulator HflC [Isosphaeraceae bacterium]